MITKVFAFAMVIAVLSSCQPKRKLSIKKQSWGTVDQKEVSLFTLSNSNGVTVNITNFGGIITSLFTPEKNGTPENIVLGFDSLNQYTKPEYQKNCPYFGALVGRFANRIAHGKFSLDGKEYNLAINSGIHHMHGGTKGFDKVVWEAREIGGSDSVTLELSYQSVDMEEGYPGNLTTTVDYVLNNKNEFKIYYTAVTDKPTVINLTSHSYFNLTGRKRDVLDHELTINADSMTVSDSTSIPTGAITSVKGSAFDFTKTQKIGKRIGEVKYGYNHNYVLNKNGANFELAAEAYEPNSGRILKMYTTEPGMQLYTGAFLGPYFVVSGGIALHPYYGLCLEPQHYPDSPNKPNFPTVVLRPGEKYSQLTVYQFSVKRN